MDPTAEDDQREDLLVSALARGATQARAAEESGLSPRTVRRRLSDPDFQAKVAAARSEMVARAAGTVAAAATTAMRTLVDLMSSGKSDRIRLQSARAIIDQLPVKAALEQVAERPEGQRIEVVLPDWRSQLREMKESGLAQSADDRKKPGQPTSDDDGEET